MEDWRSIITRKEAAEEQERLRRITTECSLKKLADKEKEQRRMQELLFLERETKEALEAYRIREKLEYIRNNVWGVGELKCGLIRSGNLIAYGYELSFSYRSATEDTEYVELCDDRGGRPGYEERGTDKYYIDDHNTKLGVYIELSSTTPRYIVTKDLVDRHKDPTDWSGSRGSSERWRVIKFLGGTCIGTCIEIKDFPQNIQEEDQQLQLELARDCDFRVKNRKLPYDLKIQGEEYIRKVGAYPTKNAAARGRETYSQRKRQEIRNRESFWYKLSEWFK